MPARNPAPLPSSRIDTGGDCRILTKGRIMGLIDDAKEHISEGVEKAKDAAAGVGEFVKDKADSVGDFVKDKAEDAESFVKEKLGSGDDSDDHEGTAPETV